MNYLEVDLTLYVQNLYNECHKTLPGEIKNLNK